LQVRDWPGFGVPLVHVPDPLRASPLVETLAAVFAPRYRVMSVVPRPDQPYQVHAADLEGLFAQLGLDRVTVLAEGTGCATAVLLAAWHPERVGALLLIDATRPAEGDAMMARSLRECPPDWSTVRLALNCAVVELAGTSPTLVAQVEQCLGSRPLP
jgi:pimeloyl-ACP methyl ester carboxylesterase